ncbi:MAG: mechanosensitive ion channel family protein [Candidatus Auribacterota bacterium]|nr:mechanosensitive ion channel family protein [Candidatus Auribacterota bacterium]
MDFLKEYTLVGNELWRWLGFFVVILISLALGRLGRIIFQRKGDRLYQSEHLRILGLVFRSMARPSVFLAALVGARVSVLFLVMVPPVQDLVSNILRILTSVTIGYIVYAMVDIVDYYITRVSDKTPTKLDDMLAPLIRKSLRITVVVAVAMFIADSLSEEPITTVIAGLGVASLAVALAAQDTVRNFIGSLVIMADKPFQIGDRITIDNHSGPVEEVGFRSTKIRTLAGHLVTVPNSDIASRVIENVGQRPYIRRLANITITYDTPPEKVTEALDILHEILDNHEGMDPELPPRIAFNEFNDCSLNLIVFYWFHPPDYWQYLEFTEKVNQQILERFNEAGIEFAFPTQTIYIAEDGGKKTEDG